MTGFRAFQRWHLPTLPLVTAVPSAVRGLTALFEMEEVFTRLTSTNLLTPHSDHHTTRSPDYNCLSIAPQRETWIHYKLPLTSSTTPTMTIPFLKPENNSLPGSLVRLGLTHLYAYTCRLSTSSSTTPLYTGTLIFRPVSHLDAFSAYLIPT